MPKDGCYADVTKRLAPLVGCPQKCLVVTDVYNHRYIHTFYFIHFVKTIYVVKGQSPNAIINFRFYKVYKGLEGINKYSDRDNLFVFEIEPGEDGEIQYAKVLMRQSRLVVRGVVLFTCFSVLSHLQLFCLDQVPVCLIRSMLSRATSSWPDKLHTLHF